jgi:hypothetical protein
MNFSGSQLCTHKASLHLYYTYFEMASASVISFFVRLSTSPLRLHLESFDLPRLVAKATA